MLLVLLDATKCEREGLLCLANLQKVFHNSSIQNYVLLEKYGIRLMNFNLASFVVSSRYFILNILIHVVYATESLYILLRSLPLASSLLLSRRIAVLIFLSFRISVECLRAETMYYFSRIHQVFTIFDYILTALD